MMKPKRLPEDEIDRLLILSLAVIAIVSIVAVTFLVAISSGSEFGIDTTIIVSLVGVVSASVGALGARRNRHTAPGPGQDTGTDTPPPPEPPPLPAYLRGEGELRFAPAPAPNLADDDTLGH